MAKYAAKGAILAVNTVAAPTVYATIPGVRDFNLPIGTADQIEVTSHDSSGGYKEFVNGLIESAEISVPVVWDGAHAQHAALVAALQAGTVLGYKITGKESTPKTYSFQALVTSIDIQWPVAGAQEATLVIKPTGAITIA